MIAIQIIPRSLIQMMVFFYWQTLQISVPHFGIRYVSVGTVSFGRAHMAASQGRLQDID